MHWIKEGEKMASPIQFNALDPNLKKPYSFESDPRPENEKRITRLNPRALLAQTFQAIEDGHTLLAKMNLQANPNMVDQYSKEGRLPIHTACIYNRVDVLELLEKMKSLEANAKTQTQKQETPLSLAIKHNAIDALNYLLLNPRVNVTYKDKMGNSFLHLAARKSSSKVLDILIKSGHFDINEKNKYGYYPALVAFEEGRFDHIERLMEAGICLDVPNGEASVFHYLVFEGQWGLIQLAFEKGLVSEKLFSQKLPQQVANTPNETALITALDYYSNPPENFTLEDRINMFKTLKELLIGALLSPFYVKVFNVFMNTLKPLSMIDQMDIVMDPRLGKNQKLKQFFASRRSRRN